MYKRRKKLINKRFQLRITLSIISVTTVVLFFVVGIIGMNANKNNKEITKTINTLKQAINANATQPNVKLVKSNIDELKKFSNRNYNLISIVIIIVLLQAIVLYYYLIRVTHRISGPIFIISNHIQDIIDGKEPDFRKLRKKDEFKELYNKIIELAEKLDLEE